MRTLPPGYTARPPTMDDAGAVTDVVNRWFIAARGVPQNTVDEVRGWWGSPSFDMERDALIIFDPNDAVVGYVDFDANDRGDELYFDGYVHPEHEGKGLGSAIILDAEERGAGMAATTETPEFRISAWAPSTHDKAHRLLERHGLEVWRRFYEMKIDLGDQDFDRRLPEGLAIRTLARGRDERATYESQMEAFQDHWNFWPIDFERWIWEVIEEVTDFDPSTIFLVVEGDEVIGGAIVQSQRAEDPKHAYVRDLWVRKPWRRQGIALALLMHVFEDFRRRGRTAVALGVDSDSPTGAPKLYERAGMKLERQNILRAKLLKRAGGISAI